VGGSFPEFFEESTGPPDPCEQGTGGPERRDTTGTRPAQDRWRGAFNPPMNAPHGPAPKTRAGPCGSLPSRTGTMPGQGLPPAQPPAGSGSSNSSRIAADLVHELYHGVMAFKRTNVYADDADLALIKEAAARLGVSEAEIIREGIHRIALARRVWDEPFVSDEETFDLGGPPDKDEIRSAVSRGYEERERRNRGDAA
jgi:hypothetical protein